MTPAFGAHVTSDGIGFSVYSASATRIWVSIFDERGDAEISRHELTRRDGGLFEATVTGLAAGTRYGFRADGDYRPEFGLWFDPEKLLVDPYAVEIDRPFAYNPELGARRGAGSETAPLMPKAIALSLPGPVPHAAPLFRPGGLIYELPVRAFSMRHPDVPEHQRGTLAALAHPAVLDHLRKLNVSAVELMPITAWIDERHLPPLKLVNAWGYNPVTFMALDPRLVPGGLAELRATVAALHDAGLGVFLDLVFNHTGESDAFGPTLSLRGLDANTYYRSTADDPPHLVNDTGTGNTIGCDRPVVRDLILHSLRHFVGQAGIDGFRFDLATILGRSDHGFDPRAALLQAMRDDTLLKDRIMIAEPWDIGPDGYQLGNFPPNFLEWNDKYRDDVRRFWRGDRGMAGALATRLAGSSDIFDRDGVARTRSVNFVAAHDGMTLGDLTRYERKHNEANGELNRDGHNENLSWNDGVEGNSANPTVLQQRARDMRALLATLFASRGAIMLTAGDEFGRTQQGNNNAYAQDNEITWLDWEGRDKQLEDFVAALSAVRKQGAALGETGFLTGSAPDGNLPDVVWLGEKGVPLSDEQWDDPDRHRLSMMLAGPEGRFAVIVNGDRRATTFSLPVRDGFTWRSAIEDGPDFRDGAANITGRTVVYASEGEQE